MRVATMESHDLAMDAIDVFRSIIEAIRKRLRLALAQGSLGMGNLCLILLYARRVLNQMGPAISAADVHSEEDRRLLREVAEDLQRLSDAMDSCPYRLASSQWSLFRVVVVRLVGALVVKAEDMAETAALGASLEFANLVKEDLKCHDVTKGLTVHDFVQHRR